MPFEIVDRADCLCARRFGVITSDDPRRFRNPFQSAVIVRDPVQLGLARRLQTLNDHPRIEIRVVHSLQEALAWLGGEDPGPRA